MEDQFKNYLFAFILVSAFGMLLLTAVVGIGGDYGMDTSEVVAGSLSIDKFNSSISSIESNAKDLKSSFDKQSIWSAVTGIVVEGFFGIAKDMITMILLPFDIIIDIMIDVFQVPAWLTSVLLGLLILGLMLAVWRLIKIGD
jgi:hypothetical protein